MTDLENLNNNTFNTSLEHITDEEAKNDITFSQESMWGQEIDDKKGRTIEEIQAELKEADAKLNHTTLKILEGHLWPYIQ